MSAARKKIDLLNMRVEPTQKKMLEKAAEATGHSLSSFVLLHALEAAHKELEIVRNYKLSLRDAQLFMKVFEKEQPTFNSKLSSAFSDYDKKYKR